MLVQKPVEDLSKLQQRSEPQPGAEILPGLDLLTAREFEIAKLVAKGFSNKEVGQILDISHWTVAAHLKSTFLKLRLKRRAELVYALRWLI